MVLVGPSGCGKTTALRMVAGLEEISEGSLIERVEPACRRAIGTSRWCSSYAPYPHHRSTTSPSAFACGGRRRPRSIAGVREAADVLGLTEFLDRKPRALSGGQRQRVAMGRAIVRQPQAYLMDEPLSNLDAKLRVHMRAGDLRAAEERTRRDDDLRHARPGRGDDDGRPRGSHAQGHAPAGRAAAGAVRASGQPLRRRLHRLAPAMNMVEATVEQRNGGLVALVGSHELALGEHVVRASPRARVVRRPKGRPRHPP